MKVSVVVPRSPGACPHRDRAWSWLARRWAMFHPAWPIVEGHHHGEPWSKGRAVLDALGRVDADIVVLADADSLVPAVDLDRAVAALEAGAPWVVPHRQVWRITSGGTDQLVAGPPIDVPTRGFLTKNRERVRYEGVAGGGITVLWRATLERVPIDPRFVGWGGEDNAFGYALDELAGPHARLEAPLVHLWHPMAPTHKRAGGALPETEQLGGRYLAAVGDAGAMLELVNEARSLA